MKILLILSALLIVGCASAGPRPEYCQAACEDHRLHQFESGAEGCDCECSHSKEERRMQILEMRSNRFN